MRLKTFIGANTNEALMQVKRALGADAIILNTESLPDGGIKITAAMEDADFHFDKEEKIEKIPPVKEFDESKIRESLNYHGVLPAVSERILARVRRLYFNQSGGSAQTLLVKDLAENYEYYNMLDRSKPLKLFMGISGSGKSTAIAKVATQAKLKKISSCIISCDNVRAGANKQLQAFAKILEVPFFFEGDRDRLYNRAMLSTREYNFVLIDTPGINPFIKEDVERISLYIKEFKTAEKIMTMDAGRNAADAVEISEVFRKIGADSLLPTRLDLSRRIGSIISIADVCQMKLGAAGVSASIVQGIAKIDANALCKLLLPTAK